MEENHKENKNIIHKTSIKNRQILNKKSQTISENYLQIKNHQKIQKILNFYFCK